MSQNNHNSCVDRNEQKRYNVQHNNKTKNSMDNMDHLVTIFSCRRKANRCPIVLVYNMLDVTGVFMICIAFDPDCFFSDRQGRPCKSLKWLGQELTDDIQIRVSNQSMLQPNVKNALKMIGKACRSSPTSTSSRTRAMEALLVVPNTD